MSQARNIVRSGRNTLIFEVYSISMKKLLAALFFLPLAAFGQSEEIEVRSEIKEVTLYLSGAQETRSARINIPAGNSTLKFIGLPGDIQANSIQVKGVSDFTILSLNFQQNHLTETEEDPELAPLRDSLEALTFAHSLLQAEKSALTEERSMFQNNRRLANNNGLSVDDLNEISEHNADRIRAIDTKLFSLSKTEEKVNKQIQKLNAQVTQVVNGRKRAKGEITVSINAKNKMTNTLVQVSYLTYSAGWKPFYDIRAEEVGGPVKLTYKAHVRQSTGSDWDNVKLTLSTTNPNISNTKPNIPVWYLDFAQDNPIYDVRATSNTGYLISGNTSSGKGAQEQAVLTQNTLNAEFKIASNYSIPSDGVEYEVEIGAYDSKSLYRYSTVPKLRQESYLMARITGWNEYSLLPANSNIYFRGTFIGKSYLQTNTTKDTLELSLGADDGVIVQRKNVSEMQSKSATGNTKKKQEDFEITIRNTKSIAIEIEIEDQIPLSVQKEITVDVLEISGAEYNKENGKLIWKLSVPPGETKKLKLSYVVKYPKNYVIGNL